MRGARAGDTERAGAVVSAVPPCAASRAGTAADHISVTAIAAVTIDCFILVGIRKYLFADTWLRGRQRASWGPNIPNTCPSEVTSSLNIALFLEGSLARKPLIVTSTPDLTTPGL
jgi:hypothetical protein